MTDSCVSNKVYDVWISSITGNACEAVTYTPLDVCDITVTDERVKILDVYMNSASWKFSRYSGPGRWKSLRSLTRLSCHHHINNCLRHSRWRLFMCSWERAKLLIMFYRKLNRECQATKIWNCLAVSIALSSRLLFTVGIVTQNGAPTLIFGADGAHCNHCLWRYGTWYV